MGLGRRIGRARVLVSLATALAVLLSLGTGTRAESPSDDQVVSTAHLPVICVHPLGRAPVDNPACSSSHPVPATIYGAVYIDTNENGMYEPGQLPESWDVPVEGSEVRLYHADWAEPLIAIPNGGYYCFEGLGSGDYTITVTLSAEDQRVLELLDEPNNIHLSGSEAIVRDFRYARWYQAPSPPEVLGHTLYLPAVAR